ncbi:unnamed protein product [Clonostachys byssicola]|uniref:AB hydrolase-1 domain-containing protein n=1 Tax=Clonostachys byssicola TaxID=160290 RepID=A0A9N9XXY7_9HYPO|nr:unnamed protein product [Clonostachys byssicola]
MKFELYHTLLAALAAPAYATSPPTASFNNSISWTACEAGSPDGLHCGQLQVPLDWSKPHGEMITLGLMKLEATSKSEKLGSLMFNPGGPGGAATTMCKYQAAGVPFFGKPLTDHFDIICPDPRGVGISSPISCDASLWNHLPSLFPKNEEEYQRLLDTSKAFASSCLELSGDLVRHVDTMSVVHDIEALRLALGDGKLNWLGISYGTQVAAQYAATYPESIRSIVMDGNVDHTSTEIYTTNAEAATYEDELVRFFEWCSVTECCPLHGQDVSMLFLDLAAKADSEAIPAPGCLATANTSSAGSCRSNVTGEDIRFNVQGNSLLTHKDETAIALGWGLLGQALNESLQGNATLLSSGWATDNNSSLWQGLVIGCLDWYATTDSFAQNEYRQSLGNAIAPHTKGASQSYMLNTRCIDWPFKPKNLPGKMNETALRQAPPILMVNAEHDPESSFLWAQNLYAQMPSATLLTRQGDGHASYGNSGEAQAIIESYLVNLTMPAKNTIAKS